MKCALAASVALAAFVSSPALAQATWPTQPTEGPGYGAPRDGVINQAVVDTVYASLRRRGYGDFSAETIATLSAVEQAAYELARGDFTCFGQPTTGWNTWLKVIACTTGIPLPFDVGRDGQPLGGFGQAGAQGEWEEALAEKRDCGDIDFKLDAEGNIIIPSYVLDFGKEISSLGDQPGHIPNGTLFDRDAGFNPLNVDYTAPQIGQSAASSAEAAYRRTLHLYGQRNPRYAWLGVVQVTSNGCAVVANVAHRRPDGSIWGRGAYSICPRGLRPHGPETQNEIDDPTWWGSEVPHRPCPDVAGANGGDFHYYGFGGSLHHFHKCTWYHPRPDITGTPDGYFISPETTIAASSIGDWPNSVPGFIRQCGIDPSLISLLGDALFKLAAQKPGYTGHPYAPVEAVDARPGDATVNDLGDDPDTKTGGAPATPKPADPDAQPVEEPTAEDDLYTDPGIGQPADPVAPTGIMDPVFAWLPDLPSIDLNAEGAACPTWQIDASAFGGEGWSWTMDAQCTLIEDQRSAISVLMIALFGLAAAMIILRA